MFPASSARCREGNGGIALQLQAPSRGSIRTAVLRWGLPWPVYMRCTTSPGFPDSAFWNLYGTGMGSPGCSCSWSSFDMPDHRNVRLNTNDSAKVRPPVDPILAEGLGSTPLGGALTSHLLISLQVGRSKARCRPVDEHL